ncbi:serine/threonine protein kinase [Trichophyton interdigitale MR816]|uniref:Serine/threonine protein kinase n=1 Tax=Trichophyton interdigitale (strain MR816) TaxID=1215338 RepID=A0A059JHE5_TRIIM|nr:serine/threonine protein kinase [Trichophyton interdigitale H6]KDB27179.1 serine/threonine protein kinase [Trichophyton interdigitale MR816]
MAPTLYLGRTLKSRTGLYTIIKQLQDCVWLATNEYHQKVIAKGVHHFRLQNERDVLLRFQHRTQSIRPLIEELEDSDTPPTLILKYLDDDVLNASDKQRLTAPEVKFVAKKVLGALAVLHDEGFIHTDVKPSNALVNYGQGESRFTDVQLADFGSTVHENSIHAQRGEPIGTPIFRSPEAQLEMKWGTATDIWSFGAMASVISLIYGEGFHIFKPDVPPGHDEYDVKILLKHHRCFGPFPESYEEIADQQRLGVLTWVMQNSPAETLRPFHLTTSKEICQADKEFVLKIMRLDPRDRPSARQLLEDQWFHQS